MFIMHVRPQKHAAWQDPNGQWTSTFQSQCCWRAMPWSTWHAGNTCSPYARWIKMKRWIYQDDQWKWMMAPCLPTPNRVCIPVKWNSQDPMKQHGEESLAGAAKGHFLSCDALIVKTGKVQYSSLYGIQHTCLFCFRPRPFLFFSFLPFLLPLIPFTMLSVVL